MAQLAGASAPLPVRDGRASLGGDGPAEQTGAGEAAARAPENRVEATGALAAAPDAAGRHLRVAWETARPALQIVLRPFASTIFSRALLPGALVALALGIFPRLAAAAFAAVAIAAVVSSLLGLGVESLRQGSAGCAALLATIALAVWPPHGGHVVALVAATAVLAVLYTSALESALASLRLPAHALPFIAAFFTVHLGARLFPPAERLDLLQPASFLPAAAVAPSWLDIPASLVLLQGAAAGALIMAAILVHSRIGFVLHLLGGAAAYGLYALLRAPLPWAGIDRLAAFNAMLTAMAIGGVWFVPRLSSLILATCAGAVACLMTYAAAPIVGIAALPVISLPFVATVHLVLMAMRGRVRDRRPRSTIPADSPEEALSRDLVRARRFGDVAWLPFRLPFRGAWFVSQGYDGAHTHQGLWRHGLDFEARTQEGTTFERQGSELRDYACYGLPVLAAGNGTVAAVVDGIPDNPPGQVNTEDNWGNAVVIGHGPGLFSVYAHLQPRSIRVKPGDLVTAGLEIARCGSSGRSPVPHLHFQLQRHAALGSPTLEGDFGDVVVTGGSGERLHTRMIPAEGQTVRPILRDEALARALSLAPGASFELTDEDTGQTEVARSEIDLFGRRTLRSPRGTITFDLYDGGLVVLELTGSRRSLLRPLGACLSRVPFDQAPALQWTDSVALRTMGQGGWWPIKDLAASIVPWAGQAQVAFTLTRSANVVQIFGSARGLGVRALISLDGGAHRLMLKTGARRPRVVRVAWRRLQPGSEPR